MHTTYRLTWLVRALFLVSVIILMSPLIASAGGNPPPPSWTVTSIDNALLGDTYEIVSAITDTNGKLHVSAYHPYNGDLVYLTNLSGTWTAETIANGGVYAVYNAIALDANNRVHISYCDSAVGQLNYATNKNGVWENVIIDDVADACTLSPTGSLAIDTSGNAHAVYFKGGPNYDLAYAYVYDPEGWYVDISTVDTVGFTGQSASIALDSYGVNHISYLQGSVVKHAVDWGGWYLNTIDPSGVAAGQTSIRVDAMDNAHLTYFDYVNGRLNYVKYDYYNDVWAAPVTIDTLDAVTPESSGGDFNSLAIDSMGNVNVSFYDPYNGDLKYVTNRTGAWTTQTVDSNGDVGYNSSLMFEPARNLFSILYRDSANGLMLASQSVTLTVSALGSSGTGSVISMPAGIVSDTTNTTSASFGFNAIVTLKAAPSGGSFFAGWSGACAVSALECNVTMNEAKTVNALFTSIAPSRFTHARTFENPYVSYEVYARKSIPTSDNGSISAGYTYDGYADYGLIVKMNASGGIEWQKNYGDGGYDYLYDIEPTADGGYIAVGATNSFGNAFGDVWVLKISANGDQEWQKAYANDNYYSDYASGRSVKPTSDGGYIIGASIASDSYAWVLKLRSDGSIVWNKTFDNFLPSLISTVLQTIDGGYVLGGSVAVAGYTDGWLVKMDANGSVTWEKNFGGPYHDGFNDVVQTPDGGFVAAGYINESGANKDAWVVKLDANGTFDSPGTWQKKYDSTASDEAYSVIQTSDGNYLAVGYAASDALFLKLNAVDGSVNWAKQFGGSGTTDVRSVRQTADTGFVMAGNTDYINTAGYFMLALKTDENGDVSDCPNALSGGAAGDYGFNPSSVVPGVIYSYPWATYTYLYDSTVQPGAATLITYAQCGVPVISVSPSPVFDFGSVNLGGSKTQIFTLSNNGTADLAINKSLYNGNPDYAFIDAGLQPCSVNPATITPGSFCTIGVRISPLSAAASDEVLWLTTNDSTNDPNTGLPNVYTVNLSWAAADTTPPYVISATPRNGSGTVDLMPAITAVFSEVTNTTSLTNPGTFTLTGPLGLVSGTVIASGPTTTFTPDSSLSTGGTYTARVTTAATDIAGNPLQQDYVWAFRINNPILPWGTSLALPQTYQISCWNSSGDLIPCAGTGQDGDVQAGVPVTSDAGIRFQYYIDNDCKIDIQTGLMWPSYSSPVYSALTTTMTWQDAFTSVDSVNLSGLCGFNDWRLPNINELESLAVLDMPPNAYDLMGYLGEGAYLNVQPSDYWTSSSFVADPAQAWAVHFGIGRRHLLTKTNLTGRFMPVRGNTIDALPIAIPATGQTTMIASGDDGDTQAGIAWPSPRFTDNANGSVRDNLTGLVWIADANCLATNYAVRDTDGVAADGAVTWQHALDFARNVNQGEASSCSAGSSDWRLPNAKELRSLVNIGASSPALPAGHPFSSLTGTQAMPYWSSTTNAANPAEAVNFDMSIGESSARSKSGFGRVWLVRGGTGQTDNVTLDVIPGSYDFGKVTVGYSASKTFMITNIGSSPVTFAPADLDWVDGSDFWLANDYCQGLTIEPGAGCAVEIAYSPWTASESNYLIIYSSSVNSPLYIPINGASIPLRTLTVHNAGTGFGSVSSDGGISTNKTMPNSSNAFATTHVITFTATPDTGYVFAGWIGGGCSGTGDCITSIAADTTITAIFMQPKESVILFEPFNNTSAMPSGWSVTGNEHIWWAFNDPDSQGNLTGGATGFAHAGSCPEGCYSNLDTELRTDALDLAGQQSIFLQFTTDIYNDIGAGPGSAYVDVSLDNGATWTGIWRQTPDTISWRNWEGINQYYGPRTELVDLSSIAAGKSNVMVRFHYVGRGYWSVDDVLLYGKPRPTITAGEAVEQPSLKWTSGGSAPWFGQIHTFGYKGNAAQSGAIKDGQESWIETTVTGPMNLSFDWKVSSESGNDYVTFFIDDVDQDEISGEDGWLTYEYTIPAGTHTLRWSYTKNTVCCTNGADAAWLDKVVFSSASQLDVTVSGSGLVTANDGSIWCNSGTCTATYVPGSLITLTSVPNPGMVFSGWSGGGCSGTGDCVVTVTDVVAVSAGFTADTTTPSVLAQSPAPGSTNVAPTAVVAATFSESMDMSSLTNLNPRSVVLTGPTGTISGSVSYDDAIRRVSLAPDVPLETSATYTVTITSAALDVALNPLAADVTWTFATRDPLLSITNPGSGSGSVSGGNMTYALYSSATLTAEPAIGSVFMGWSGGGCSGIGPCFVASLPGDTSVTATFNKIYFELAAPVSMPTGTIFDVVVTAKETSGTIVSGFTGTVAFESTDPNAVLPVPSLFTGGTNTYSITMMTAGQQLLSVVSTDVDSTYTGAPSDYWNFDEGTGTIANDPVSGRNGVLVNGMAWSPDVPSVVQFPDANSLLFNGSDSYVNLSSVQPPNLTTPAFTIQTWVKPASLGDQSLLTNSVCGWNCATLHLGIGPEQACSGSGVSGKISYYMITSAGAYSLSQTSTPVIGQWTHVSVTYDGAVLKLYINGALEASTPATGILSGNYYYTLGADPGYGCGGFLRYLLNGNMDDLRIYDHALTAGEVAYIAAGNKGDAGSSASIQVINRLTVERAGSGDGQIMSLDGHLYCPGCTSVSHDYTQQDIPVTLTAIAYSGSLFTGWSGNGCSGTGDCTLSLSSSATVTATFITDVNGPTGDIKINYGASTTSNPKVLLTLTANDLAGVDSMRFSSDNATWSAPVSFATSTTWMLDPADGFKTVFAQFADMNGQWSTSYSTSITLDQVSTYDLFLSTGGTGTTGSVAGLSGAINCPSVNCSTTQPAGAYVTLIARPGTNAYFTGWSGDACNGTLSLTCTVYLDASKNVSANFSDTTSIPQTWITSLSATNMGLTGRSAQQTSDGGAIVIGDSLQSSSGYIPAMNIVVSKLTSTGALDWQRFYAMDNATDISSQGYSIQQTLDGGYVLVGQGFTGTVFVDGIYQIVVIKLDAQGNNVWQKTYQRFNITHYETSHGYAIQQTADGGYVLTGDINSWYKQLDAAVIKLDAYGDLEWQQSIGGSNFYNNNETARSIAQTSDSGYILTGDGFSPNNSGYQNIIVSKLTTTGAVDWQTAYDTGGGQSYGNAIRETADSGYVLAGRMLNVSGANEGLITRLSSTGAVLWNKKFSDAWSNNVAVNDALQTADNGYALLAVSSGMNTHLIKLDESGNELWQRLFPGIGGSTLQQTADSGFLISGTGQNGQIIMIKTDANGEALACNAGASNAKLQLGTAILSVIDIQNTPGLPYPYTSVDPAGSMISFNLSSPSASLTAADICVNALNNAPTAPELTSPANSGQVPALTNLSWNPATDQDLWDVLSYDVYLDTNPSPATLVANNLAGTFTTMMPLNANTTYYWKVVARDNNGGATESAVWSFSTQPVFTINSGAAVANSPQTLLVMNPTLVGSMIAMQFSSDNTNWQGIQDFALSTPWTLDSAVTGTQIVYGQFQAYDGVWSGPFAASIALDMNRRNLSLDVQTTGSGAVTSQITGINCGANCSAQYPVGTFVVLTARPDANAYFSGWDGACYGVQAPTCVVRMDAVKSVIAQFADGVSPVATTWITALTYQYSFTDAYKIAQTSDGGYIMAGNIYSEGDAMLVVKLNADGSVAWENGYGTGSEYAYSITQTVDNGYVLIGQSLGNISGDFILVMKLDATGAVQWKKYLGTGGSRGGGGGNDIGYAVKPTADGGFVLTGAVYDTYDTLTDQIAVIKLDIAGNVEWEQNIINGFGYTSEGYAIQQTSDRGYVLTGYIMEDNPDYGLANHIAAVKLDSMGNILWQRTYGGNGYGQGASIRETTDGNYALIGQFYAYDWLYNNNSNAAIVLKINAESGAIQWQKMFSATDDDVYGYDIVETADHGMALVAGTGGQQAHLIKIDQKGNLVWQKKFKDVVAMSLEQTSDNGFILGGKQNIPDLGWTMVAIKTDASGQVAPCMVAGPGVFKAFEGILSEAITDSYLSWIDDYGWSTTDDTWSFNLDAVPGLCTDHSGANNTPPAAFSLANPSDGSIGSWDQPLSWNVSSDPDPGDTVVYDLYISLASDLTGTMTRVIPGLSTTWTTPFLEKGKTYYWKVVAHDNNGGSTDSNEIWSFTTIANEQPIVSIDPAAGYLTTTACTPLRLGRNNWTYDNLGYFDPNAGRNVYYDYHVSDNDGSLVKYEWTIVDAVNSSPTVTYSSQTPLLSISTPGFYYVTLRATDNNGAVADSLPFLVEVTPNVLWPDFTMDHVFGPTNLAVSFKDLTYTANSCGGLTYSWDFGDGSAIISGPAATAPMHTYTQHGTYSVTLSIYSAASNTTYVTRAPDAVVVYDPPTDPFKYLYVYYNADGGSYGTPSDPYTNIQQAVDQANFGTIIRVAQGTYYENITINDAHARAISIEGGWDSGFTTRSNDPSLTIIDGDTNMNGPGDDGSVVRIENMTAGRSRFDISGITLQHGNGTVNASPNATTGGGLYMRSDNGLTEVNLTNNRFVHNVTAAYTSYISYASYGSGIYVSTSGGPVNLVNNTIADNSSDSNNYDTSLGAGIYVATQGGKFVDSGGPVGRPVLMWTSPVTLSGNTITDNYAYGYGRQGAYFSNILVSSSSNTYSANNGPGLEVESGLLLSARDVFDANLGVNLRITGNVDGSVIDQARSVNAQFDYDKCGYPSPYTTMCGHAFDGHGISVQDISGQAVIKGSLLEGNYNGVFNAAWNDPGYSLQQNNVWIESTRILKNTNDGVSITAGNSFDGMGFTSKIDLVNDIIADNGRYGVYYESTSFNNYYGAGHVDVNLVNTTISNNSGGGFYIYESYDTAVNVSALNSILWGNGGFDVAYTSDSSGRVSMAVGRSDIGVYLGDYPWYFIDLGGNMNTDPMLTQGYYLASGSPVIAQGTAVGAPATDIDGVVRAGGIDLGAHQYVDTASVQKYTLTVIKTTSGPGTGGVFSSESPSPLINCGGSCSMQYEAGSVVTLWAVPGSPAVSVNSWSGGGCSGNGLSCTVVVTNDMAINVAFDDQRPYVTSVRPADGASSVRVNSTISVGFNTFMTSSTINNSTFVVTGPGGIPVPGTITDLSGDYAEFMFMPASNLASDATYTVTLLTDIRDQNGYYLPADHVWSFRTGPAKAYEIPAAANSVHKGVLVVNSNAPALQTYVWNDWSDSLYSVQSTDSGMTWGAIKTITLNNAWDFAAEMDGNGNTVLIWASYNTPLTPNELYSATKAFGDSNEWITTLVDSGSYIGAPSVFKADAMSIMFGYGYTTSCDGPCNMSARSLFWNGSSLTAPSGASFNVTISSYMTAQQIWADPATGNLAYLYPDNGYGDGSRDIISIEGAAYGALDGANSLLIDGNASSNTANLDTDQGLLFKGRNGDFVSLYGNIVIDSTNGNHQDLWFKHSSLLATMAAEPSFVRVNDDATTVKLPQQDSIRTVFGAQDNNGNIYAVWSTQTGSIVYSRINTGDYTVSPPARLGDGYLVHGVTFVPGAPGKIVVAASMSSMPVLFEIVVPSVISTIPAAAASNVFITSDMRAAFSTDMDAATISDTSFILEGPVGAVTGTVSYNAGSRTATFTPLSSLSNGETYTATILSTVADPAQVSLSVNHVWSFTTTPLPVISLISSTTVLAEAGSLYTDAGATAFSTLDGDLTSNLVVTNAVNDLLPGSYSVTYNVSDTQGNAATPVIRTVNVVDTTAPVITMTGPSPVSVERLAVYTDLGATATDIVDGSLAVTTANTVNTAVTGTYTVTYTVSDTHANAATAVVRTVTVVDTTAPDTTITGTPANLTSNPTATFTFTQNEGLTFECQLDGAGYSACTSPKTYTSLTDSAHTFDVRAIDLSLNPDPTPASYGWTVDTTNPGLTVITLGDGSYTNSSTLNITGTATDTNGLQSLLISGNTVTVSGGNYTYALLLTAGSNTVMIVATDQAGNQTTNTRTITYDSTFPALTITTPSDNSVTNNANITVDGTMDETSTVTVSLNSGPTVTAATNSTSFSQALTLIYGTNVIDVYATDLAGNTTTKQRTVTYDNVNPSLAITSPGAGVSTNISSITISGTISDLTTTAVVVSCPTATVGIVSYPTTTTWTVDITNLTAGVNAITAIATDQAGNSTNVTRNVIYDTTAPGITIDPVTTPTKTGTQTVTGTMEQNATVIVTSATAGIGVVSYPTATSWSVDITLISQGTNTLTATATDAANNSASASRAIIYDTIAPVITMNGTSPVTVEAGTAYTDLGATALDNIEGTLTNSISTTNPVNNLVPGSYSVTYNVSDTTGNAATPVIRTVNVVDTTAPVITMTGPSPVSVERLAIYTDLGATATDIVDGVLTVTTANTVNTAVTGTYTVTYTVSDTHANAATPVVRTVIVQDTIAPTLSIVSMLSSNVTTTLARTGDVITVSFIASDNLQTPSVLIAGNAAIVTGGGTNWSATYSMTGIEAEGMVAIQISYNDLSGNPGVTVTSTTDLSSVTYDRTAPVFTLTSPAGSAHVNTTHAGYTLSETVASGSIVFTSTSGTDVTTAYTYTLQTADRTLGSHSIDTGLTLINGSVYTVSFNATDPAGNPATTVDNLSVAYDTTGALALIQSPLSSTTTNTTQAQYSLSEALQTASLVYTVVSGTDPASPHTYLLTGTELQSGVHGVPTGFSLIDGAVYNVSLQDIIDLASNPTATVTNTSITYDVTSVAITGITPLASTVTTTTSVSYSLSEQVQSGSIVFTSTTGTDSGSVYTYTMKPWERTPGSHTAVTYLGLMDDSIYSMSISASDMVGNPATTITNAAITYDGRHSLSVSISGAGTIASDPGAFICGASCTITYDHGTTVTLSANPDISSDFIGWSGGGCGGTGACVVNLTNDTVVTATFTPKQYSITAITGANGSITSVGTTTVSYGGSQSYTITPDTGYDIADVQIDGSTYAGLVSNYTFSNVNQDHAISVTFAIKTYTITASSGGNGSVAPAGPTTVNYNGSQIYTITPNAGYRVLDVVVDGVSIGAVASVNVANVTKSCTITATFDLATRTITATAGANGAVTPVGITMVNYNNSQSYTITPDAGYHIADVLVDGLSVGAVANVDIPNVTVNHTIGATFAINTFAITATSGGNGAITPVGTSTVNYRDGQSYTITPNVNYHVLDVMVDGVSYGAVSTFIFTNVMAPHTINATFELDTRTITATAGANGSVTPSGAKSVNYGASQAYTITPGADYHIRDVLVDGVSVGAVTSYNFTNVTANHAVVASFALNDAAAPTFGSTSPASATLVNTAIVGYDLSENAASGTVTFAWVSGAEDLLSPHVYTFTTPDKTAGPHSINTGLTLVSGAVYDVIFSALDAANNTGTITQSNVTYDHTAAVVTIQSPLANSWVNSASLRYSLSEAIAEGSIIITRTGGAPDALSPYTYVLDGLERTAGNHTVNTGAALVTGTIYSIEFTDIIDQAGNVSAPVWSLNVTFDTQSVSVANITPAIKSIITNAVVSFTLFKDALAGTITFTRTGGAVDSNASHTFTLASTELLGGVHTVDTGFALVNGAFYTVTLQFLDRAGNPPATVSNAMVFFDKNYGKGPVGNIANEDGLNEVNDADVQKLKSVMGARPGSVNWNPACDLNKDNVIDAKDLMLLNSHYGEKTL